MYEQYYDEYEEFESFKKIPHQKPKNFKNEQRTRSAQDSHKAKRKAKDQEKKKIIKDYQSSYE